MKPRITDALIERAHESLFPNGKVTSQSGLTRTELRALARRGIVTRAMVKHEKSGVIEGYWRMA